jgi:hypothetical protein
VLLKQHFSTEENPNTAALIRELRQARVRGYLTRKAKFSSRGPFNPSTSFAGCATGQKLSAKKDACNFPTAFINFPTTLRSLLTACPNDSC